MAIVAGADGCHDKWICLLKDTVTGIITHQIFNNAHDLIYQIPTPEVLMIDVPIGLANGPRRQPDIDARALLGTRSCCVFDAPIRPALLTTSYANACSLTFAAIGKKITKQAWGIFPKVADVDTVLSAN